MVLLVRFTLLRDTDIDCWTITMMIVHQCSCLIVARFSQAALHSQIQSNDVLDNQGSIGSIGQIHCAT